MNVAAIEERLDRSFERDLEDIRSFLRMPSISSTGEGIRETAEAVKAWIKCYGGEARLVSIEGGYHPIVYGKLDSGAPHTLLIYGMYDVMPVDEPGWIAPPFGAEIHEWQNLGKCIINRGATNTKGPLCALFTALRAVLEVEGRLPVNLLFVIEGEEERGSKSLAQFVPEYREELREAEAMFFAHWDMDERGNVTSPLGCKGMIEVQLTCRGGEWGGPTVRGIHSYNSAWIANPVWRLVSALSTMCDKNERITIDGFLDQVREPSEEDRGLCKRLAESGFLEHMLSTNDTLRFKWDVPPEEVCLRAYTQPQINISGIWGGYTGPGSKTLLPHEVTVRMDIRTVPDMDADVAERLIRKHLDSCGYADIETQFSIGSPWSKVDISAPIVQAVLTAYRNMGVEPAFMPNSLGGEPNYLWSRVLGIPYMRGGMGHGARSHSSNEYCTVAGLLSMEKFVVHVLDNYVKLALI